MKEKQMDLDRAVHFLLSGKREVDELDRLIGLQEFKSAMRQVLSAQKRVIIAYSRGLDVRPAAFHMCFLGNPGTGKTEMSRMAAKIMYNAGVVSEEKLLIAGRSDLIGEHVGETALKTKSLLKRASGGVLLIDEAYALLDDRQGSFGDEAINTLVDEMEKHRSELVIIFAGYPDPMKRLLSNNPGLQSRIPYIVHFPDYTEEQLYKIAEKFAKEDGYYFRQDVRAHLHGIFRRAMKENDFGNARYVRNLLEKAEAAKADKVDLMQLMTLSDDDLFQLTPEEFSGLSSVRECVTETRIGF